MNKKHNGPLIAFFSGALIAILGGFLAFGFNIWHYTLKERAERIKLTNAVYMDIHNKMITMYEFVMHNPYKEKPSFSYITFDFDIYKTYLQKFLLFPEDDFKQIIKFYGELQQYYNSANLFINKTITIEEKSIVLGSYKRIFIAIIIGNKIIDALEKQHNNLTLQEMDKNQIKDLKERVFQQYPELSQSALPKKLVEDINEYYIR